MSFELVKWYTDCVAPDGAAAIGYCATLHWPPLPSLHYESILLAQPGGKPRSLVSHRKTSAPVAVEGGFRWDSPGLDFAGTWIGRVPAIRETVYECKEGVIDWNCLLPRAEARVRVAGAEIAGWGYVECLRMTVRPWRLPLTELGWGRFFGPSRLLVWIDWKGTVNRTLIYADGGRLEHATVSPGEVRLSGAALSLDRGRVLRDGPIGTTVFRAVPGLNRLAPARMLRVEECKWLSRGVWRADGGAEEEGWAIHEVVRWPR